MEKQTKILLGLGAVIVAILILNSKKVAGQSGLRQPLETGGGEAMTIPDDIGGGVGIVQSPDGDLKPVVTGKKTAVEPTTKDCVQVGYDCTKNFYNTIHISLDADCNDYQPAMPQCAPPRGGDDMLMTAPLLSPLNNL